MSGGTGYFVHVAESVEAYIRGMDALPEPRRQQVLEACLQDLAGDADHFLHHYPWSTSLSGSCTSSPSSRAG
jgi:hypothetical protein